MVPAGRPEWLGLIDGFILLVRALLPKEWARFCEIAEEVQALGPSDVAGRHLLQCPLSPDSKAPSPPQHRLVRNGIVLAAEVRREKLIRESLILRYRFNALFAGEMRKGNWETRGFSPVNGLDTQSLVCAAWSTADLELSLVDNVILRNGKEWLVGVQIRPSPQQPDNPDAELSASDLKVLAELQEYAERESKKHGGAKVKQDDLVHHATRKLGTTYRKGRFLTRRLPEHLINQPKR